MNNVIVFILVAVGVIFLFKMMGKDGGCCGGGHKKDDEKKDKDGHHGCC